MCIVIISLFIKAADADAPAAVAVPTQAFHIAGFHGNDRRANLPHHVMAEMLAAVAERAGRAKIVVIVIRESLCNRGKRFQAIVYFIGAFQPVFPDIPAQHGMVGFVIIMKVFHICRELF